MNVKMPTIGVGVSRTADAATKTKTALTKKPGTKTGPATTKKTTTPNKGTAAAGRGAVAKKLVAKESASTKKATEVKQQECFTKALAAALLGAKCTKIKIIEHPCGIAVRKITTVKFRHLRTVRLLRNLRIPWKLMPTRSHMDSEQRNTTTTEVDMNKIENNDKVVFLIAIIDITNKIGYM